MKLAAKIRLQASEGDYDYVFNNKPLWWVFFPGQNHDQHVDRKSAEKDASRVKGAKVKYGYFDKLNKFVSVEMPPEATYVNSETRELPKTGVVFDLKNDGVPENGEKPELQVLTHDDGGVETPPEQSLLMDDLQP